MKLLLLNPVSGKPWNGLTIYAESLGGSEAAAAYMARELVRQEQQVVVVSHGQPGVFDGVVYASHNDLPRLLADDWDVVISSRSPEPLTWDWHTKWRVIWLHDMPTMSGRINANEAFCISNFQAQQYGFGEGVAFVTHNGYDPSLFNLPRTFRNDNKLVWVSNPDRGLPVAARIFQEIRQRWPALELHVYGRSAVYGWSPEVERPFLPQPQYMENVFLHEPLSRARLASELKDAWAMFYPTYWPETFCIAALEAQACGTPVISSPVGALPETVQGGILTTDFLNAISQLRNYSRWKKLSDKGREYASTKTWADAARGWIQHFQERVFNGVAADHTAASVPAKVGAPSEG